MSDSNFRKMPPDFKERYRLMIRKEMEERMKKKQERMQKEANKKARKKVDQQRKTLELAR
tara:strand:+ start:1445 stop:1624 length:180 start_codon:yes stop_codon:yes gene_type:complete